MGKRLSPISHVNPPRYIVIGQYGNDWEFEFSENVDAISDYINEKDEDYWEIKAWDLLEGRELSWYKTVAFNEN